MYAGYVSCIACRLCNNTDLHSYGLGSAVRCRLTLQGASGCTCKDTGRRSNGHACHACSILRTVHIRYCSDRDCNNIYKRRLQYKTYTGNYRNSSYNPDYGCSLHRKQKPVCIVEQSYRKLCIPDNGSYRRIFLLLHFRNQENTYSIYQRGSFC